jgi:hypothetical protein
MKLKVSLLPVLMWFAVLSLVGTFMHVDLIDLPNYMRQQKLHHKIITHSAPAPYQYRILQPVIVDTVLNTFRSETGTHKYKLLFLGSYAFIRFLSIFITLVAVFFSLRLIWTKGIAVLSATALAAFLPFTYRYYYYQPTSVLEMAFFGLGLLAIIMRTPSALLLLVVVGTLNRETMCFVPCAYFLYWLPKLRRTEWIWLVISVFTWILFFCGLRILWPVTHNLLDISKSVSLNLELSRKNLDLLVMLSPLTIILLSVRQIPSPYLRLALCSVPWIVLHFFTSLWYEIRYFMPMLIWLLPSLVFIFLAETPLEEN